MAEDWLRISRTRLEDDITTDLEGKDCGNVRYMELARELVKWPVLASSVLNLRVLLPNGHCSIWDRAEKRTSMANDRGAMTSMEHS